MPEQQTEKPQHLGIILDGNRRFAKRLALQPWKGHEYGRVKVEKLLEWARNQGVKELTIYALSQENIKNRPEKELEMILKIFREAFRNLDNKTIEENKVRIRFIGDSSLLPEDLHELCRKLEEKTKKNGNFVVNFAIAYGGRQELIEAIKKILKNKLSPEDLTEEEFKKHLYLANEPDLIIRTGGEKRTSNFLPWQSTYSEWIFMDKMWPEFEEQDLKDCITEFSNRKRRFGK